MTQRTMGGTRRDLPVGNHDSGLGDALPPWWAALRSWPGGVFGVALAGAFVIYARVWADPFANAPGGRGHYNDPMQAMWNLKWVPWALLHGHDPFGTDAIYYPHGVSLSWNTVMPTLGIARRASHAHPGRRVRVRACCSSSVRRPRR